MTVKPKDIAPLGAIAQCRFLAAIPAALGASLAAGAAQEQPPRVGKATLDCAEKIWASTSRMRRRKRQPPA
jgi:hypothetical protein